MASRNIFTQGDGAGRLSVFAAARSNAKAAMIGWLLSEAVNADIGFYEKSYDAFPR
jgi:hypothetical protein